MATAGWYPDPDGTPGRFRYWDGRQWSAATTDSPQADRPSGAADHPEQSGRPRSRTGLIIGGLAIAVVLAVIVTLVVRTVGDHRDRVLDDPDPPPSTASGWDDSSPLPTASPTPTASPRSPSPSSNPKVACAIGDPTKRAAHPSDGRVHGGRLSMRSPDSSWNDSNRFASGLTFAHDVGLVDKVVAGHWYESASVGEVWSEDGFRTPEQAADGITQCIASSNFYSGFQGRRDIFSKQQTVDGKSGWALRTAIRVDDAGNGLEGDISQVIVVDTGRQGRLSFFWGCVPIDDTARLKQMEAVMADLRVS